jgi:hypothetical protein
MKYWSVFNHLALDQAAHRTVGSLPGLHDHRNLHHDRKSHRDRLREKTF